MSGIIRVKHRRDPYVVIDRRAMEDVRLSWAARGLLGYLLSKPDDWQIRVSDLRRRGDLGRDAVRRLLQHLQDVGYVRREQARDAQGRLTGIDYTVFEVPDPPGPDSPGPAHPAPGCPGPDQPEPAKATLLSNQLTKYPVNQVTTTTTTTTAGENATGGGRRKGADVNAAGQSGSGDHRCDDRVDRRHRRHDGKAVRAGRQVGQLHCPRALSKRETAEAKRQLAGLPVDLAQQLIDELAGRMAGGVVRGSPLSYLRGLIARAAQGAFTPEAALSIAAARENQRRTEVALIRASRAPELPPADENNPLVKRARRIRDRALAREGRAKSAVVP